MIGWSAFCLVLSSATAAPFATPPPDPATISGGQAAPVDPTSGNDPSAAAASSAGGDAPTGVSGGFGGTIPIGSGSYDPYELNASRSITDIVVAGAVVPFTYTRTWHSRKGVWSTNWSWGGSVWEKEQVQNSCAGGTTDPNNWFRGYTVDYPDGQVVNFKKPQAGGACTTAPERVAGIYRAGEPTVQDWFEVKPDQLHADLHLSDGTVVTFLWQADYYGYWSFRVASIADPYGRVVTIDYDPDGTTIITEPGGRSIRQTLPLPLGGAHQTATVTASLGQGVISQSVTYTSDFYISGSYISYPGDGSYGPNVKTNEETVTYHNVIDPATGLPVQAHYTYKWVYLPCLHTPCPTPPPAIYRLVWASDPMFDGPLQQVRYIYTDHPLDSNGDTTLTAVKEERYATSLAVPGIMVNRFEMLPSTWSSRGYSEGYYTRLQTRGDGPTRTISYFNPTMVFTYIDGSPQQGVGRGQNVMDHLTDFTNNPAQTERHEYEWDQSQALKFQTPTKITDALGHITSQTLEQVRGHVTDQQHPDNSHSSWTYTDPNNPYYVKDKTDELGHKTYYTRDPASHLVTRVDYPDGGFETFVYNGFGQVTEHRMTSGGTEKFSYDRRGLKTEYRDPYHAAGNPTFRYQYDTKDRLSGVTDARGSYPGDPAYTTNYEYNARHQLTRTIHPTDSATGQRYTIQNVYDMQTGTLTSTTDELGHPTSYTYDEYRRVLTVRNPMGETTTNYYGLDWAHPLAHTTNNVKYTLSPMNKNIVFDYDANFRKVDQVAALGMADEAWTLFEYDAVGNLTKTTDPRFKETRFGYDQRNRKIWMDDPIASDRNSSGHTMNWEYDAVGNKRFETRADNATREWRYDSMNRLTDNFGFAGAVDHTHYDHDQAGNVTWITDAKGAQYAYYYDQLNRKVSQWYPVDATGVSRYDAWYRDVAGNIIRHDSPEHNVQIFEYDNRNRMTLSYWWNYVGPSVVTGYDNASRVTSITTNNGETTVNFGYDAANRQVWEDQTLAGYPTRRVETPRDADGNRASLQVAGAYYIGYTYTQRNQLASIGNFANFTYDAAGNMTKRQGVWCYTNDTNFAYDDMNRMTMVEQGGANGWIFARSHYQYDKVGRETATWRDEDTGSGSGWGERFEYENSDQVKKVFYNAQNAWTETPQKATNVQEYGYSADKLNRTSVSNNGVTTGYTMPDGMNQYTNVGNQAIGYDNHFNIASYNGNTFAYDAENHLVAGSMQATYDGLGRCVRRTTEGGTILFTYDGWKPILEWVDWGGWLAWNIYGAGSDEILARHEWAGGNWIYKQDKQSSVVAVLDGSGTVAEKYHYDVFGQPTVTDYWGNVRSVGNGRPVSWCGNRFMFTGREYIAELGIYDYRHRMYHPGLGRFLQTDPTGFDAGDMNLFRYCDDDPVDRTDPTGLLTRDWPAAVRAIDQAETIPFFQAEAQSMIFAAVAAAVQQIPVAGKLDSAARELGPRLVEMSRTNSDNSPEGTGWERGRTVGLVGGKPVEGGRINVADTGTRFTGPQSITWTDPPPGATQYVFVHAHTSTAHDPAYNTMTTRQDRNGANQVHSAIYTVAAGPHGGYITERYRPSAVRQDRIQGINGVTELWSNGQWQRISN